MDPNATLAAIRDAIAELATRNIRTCQRETTGCAFQNMQTDLLLEVVENFQHLDNWLAAHHGFLPDAWQPVSE